MVGRATSYRAAGVHAESSLPSLHHLPSQKPPQPIYCTSVLEHRQHRRALRRIRTNYVCNSAAFYGNPTSRFSLRPSSLESSSVVGAIACCCSRSVGAPTLGCLLAPRSGASTGTRRFCRLPRQREVVKGRPDNNKKHKVSGCPDKQAGTKVRLSKWGEPCSSTETTDRK